MTVKYFIIGLTLANVCYAQTPTPTFTFECGNELGLFTDCPPCWADREATRQPTAADLVAVIAEMVDGCPPGPGGPFDPSKVCWGDSNNSGEITTDELEAVVTEVLEGCPR